ncbi:MAG TPA: hypothetical protein VFS39_17425 [Nitrospira sp.]|nr:hypothetical protein [Nitrospira sp.]
MLATLFLLFFIIQMLLTLALGMALAAVGFTSPERPISRRRYAGNVTASAA